MKTIMLGALALIVGVVLLALSVGTGGIGSAIAGNSPTPDPTADPCEQKKLPEFCNPTQPPRRESTNTPATTATNTAGPTDVPSTAAPTSPPARATPGGGAGAGGVSPPDTGTGPGDGSDLQLSWLLVLGAALALAGCATTVYGVRRGR